LNESLFSSITYTLVIHAYLNVARGEFLSTVCLVDDLSHPDHLTLVVAYRHRQYQVSFVASAQVYFTVETGILKMKQLYRIIIMYYYYVLLLLLRITIIIIIIITIIVYYYYYVLLLSLSLLLLRIIITYYYYYYYFPLYTIFTEIYIKANTKPHFGATTHLFKH